MLTSELVQQWYDEVWNNANEGYIDQMMARDVIVHGLDPAGSSKGIENFKSFYRNFRESFPTVNVKATPLVSNHEFSAVYCIVSARSAKGKDVSFSGISISRYNSEGKIVEGWNNFDFLKMYQQLGHILVAQIENS